jgi:6-phosphogluconolactonase
MYVYVTCYNKFENLAHAPSGTPSTTGLEVYKFDERSGTLVRSSFENSCPNPSFLRFHPTKDVVYTCSEGITQNDELWAYKFDRENGKLTQICKPVSLHGRSSCYLTIDGLMRNILFTNYWDSSVGCLSIDEAGLPGQAKLLMKTDPSGHTPKDRSQHIADRQIAAHAHAIVLDPSGTIAFVPDLGRDILSEFRFDPVYGILQPVGTTHLKIPGIPVPYGPRYMAFHPSLDLVFVVMEMSCTIAVFSVNMREIAGIAAGLISNRENSSVLTFVGSYDSYPKDESFKGKNTCGRICISPDENFVVVSNRGHDSLRVFRIVGKNGRLDHCCTVHSGGRTPRHFKFHPNGNFVFSANQDSDNVSVFQFDKANGMLHTVSSVKVNSPNFIGCIDEQIGLVRCKSNLQQRTEKTWITPKHVAASYKNINIARANSLNVYRERWQRFG